MEAGARVYVPLDVIARCRNNGADGNGTGGRSHRRLSSSGGKGGQGPGTPSAAALSSSSTTGAAGNGQYWPGQIQDVRSSDSAVVVTVKLLPAADEDDADTEAAASRGVRGGGAVLGLEPPVRAGEMVTVDLEALHGGRPLPMLDPKVTAQPHGVEDMAALDHLHEAALLHNLARRHALARPYTATGPTVLAVNPYRWLGPLYGERVAADYLAAALDSQNPDASPLPPHIYATAAAAYRGLVDGGRDQSILVSGESGSGKTESVKIMMGLLAQASASSSSPPPAVGAAAAAATSPSPAAHDGADNGGGQNGAASIVERVLRSNPLLEAFGNAKTVRNDNSSRFGKYQSLEFRLSDGRLVGSHCQTYLLEKSRVVGPPSHQHAGAPSTAKERNYHIFYQLLSAAATSAAEEEGMDWAAELLLSGVEGGVGGPATFRYLRGGDCETDSVEGVTDREAFDRTLQGLSVIGVDAEHRRLLLRALAGILHLGEVDFVAAGAAANNGEGSGEEEAVRVSDLSPTGPLARAAALLLLSEGTGEGREGGRAAMALLADGLCARSVVVRGETLVVPLTAEQAGHAREALAKEVYARLFRWLVGRVNASTAAVHAHAQQGRKEAVGRVALLDIFGFECFPHNSFEQLLINYANERLQQQFTQDVFKAVQAEYDEEGVPWEHVDFEDNAETLALLEGRMGVISLLNEEGLRPKGSDAAFVSKLWAVHGDHPALEQGPTLKAQGAFVVRHYAGAVCYTPSPPFSSSSSSSFLEKNRDAMPERLAAALAKGGSPLLASLFRPPEPKTEQEGVGRRGSGALVADTVASQFRKQLGDLMEAVGRTDVRYVRCLKPNASKSPQVFERGLIADQLRCAGVLEAIRISRAAWPTRLTHAAFLRRFRPLLRRALGSSFSNTTTIHDAAALLLSPAKQEAVIGVTKIYFRSAALEGLEAQRTALVREAATAVEAQMRRFLAQGRYQAARRATIALQAHHRSRRARRAFLRHRAAAAALQRQWRRTLARRAAQRQREAAAARRIQSAVRGYRARTAFASQRAAAVRVQAAVRGYFGWKEGRALLAAARVERKLETQLERLKARLEEELTARRAAEERVEQLALSSSSAILEEEDGRERGVTVELEEQSLLTIRRLQAEKAALAKEVAILREDNARLNALVARLRSEKTSQADVAQSMILALHQQQQHQQQQQHRGKAVATTASTSTPSPLLSLSPLRPPLPSLAATSPIPTAANTPINPWHTALPADCVPPPLNAFWTHVPAASVAEGGLEDGAEVHFKSGERYLFDDQGFLRWTIQADPSRGYPANTAFYLERVPPYLLPPSAPENGSGGGHHTNHNHNAVVYALRSAKTGKYVNLGGFFSRQRLRCTVARLQDGAALFRALPLLMLAPPAPPPSPLAGVNGGTPTREAGVGVVTPSPSPSNEDEGEAHGGAGSSVETTTKSVRGDWLSLEEQGLLLALVLHQPSSAAASSSGFTKPPSALRLTDDGYVMVCKCPPPPPPPAPSAAGHKRLTTTTNKEGEEVGASSSLVADAAASSPAAGKEEHSILRAPAAAAAYTGGPVPSLLTVEALSARDSYEIEFNERQLGLRVDPKAMPLRVMGVTPPAPDGTPSEAERTGRIHAGDVVISADGISLLGGSSGDGMTREECLALLQRGPRPTRVGFLVGSALRKARAPGAKEAQEDRASSLLSRAKGGVRRGNEGTVGGMMAPAAESIRAGVVGSHEEEEEERGQPPPVDPAFAVLDQFFGGVERRLFGEQRGNPDEGATAGASSGDGKEEEDDDQGLGLDASNASATAAAAVQSMASFFGF